MFSDCRSDPADCHRGGEQTAEAGQSTHREGKGREEIKRNPKVRNENNICQGMAEKRKISQVPSS